ncbi:HPF/RaiA family ribosome-associated protein [Crocinitomix catalasitica]|mgnify:CR=1 FL=1|uniref:HPF/RaiA family ribosome-associated protein n=1 Tax=Crocinitomix catalasitica TaxID=184607 RepID=UPI0004848288|nr:HPF/RaiA family ribosome-associated protein [Crocinitomix catalasitica]
MTIQINTDNNIKSDAAQQDYFNTQISEALERFDSHITRIEVHLKDENGKKDGVNDKVCVLEARLKGKQPVAVTKNAETIELAVFGAIDKMKAVVESAVGKAQTH